MTVWDDLTPIQADAVRATAAAHLRDPEELARELRPLVHIPPWEIDPPELVEEPATDVLPALETRSVSFTASLSPEAAWILLGSADDASSLLVRAIPSDPAAVNDPLTPPLVP